MKCSECLLRGKEVALLLRVPELSPFATIGPGGHRVIHDYYCPVCGGVRYFPNGTREEETGEENKSA